MLTSIEYFISEDTTTVIKVAVDDKSLLPPQDRLLSRVKRKAITSEHNLWPGGVIVYTMSGGVDTYFLKATKHN